MRLNVRTARGQIHLVGHLQLQVQRPTLFVMGGMGPIDYLHVLVDWFPGASVLIAPFPGMSGSTTTDRDVRNFAAAVDDTIAAVSPDRPVVMFGTSAGCLPTLGARSPQIVHRVALEPFLHTAPLWPLHDAVRRNWSAGVKDADGEATADKIFGLSTTGVVDRDYSWVLDGLTPPLDVILAAQPLEPKRPVTELPSLTSADDRRTFAALAGVTSHDGPPGSGHHIMGSQAGSALVREILLKALLQAHNSQD